MQHWIRTTHKALGSTYTLKHQFWLRLSIKFHWLTNHLHGFGSALPHCFLFTLNPKSLRSTYREPQLNQQQNFDHYELSVHERSQDLMKYFFGSKFNVCSKFDHVWICQIKIYLRTNCTYLQGRTLIPIVVTWDPNLHA